MSVLEGGVQERGEAEWQRPFQIVRTLAFTVITDYFDTVVFGTFTTEDLIKNVSRRQTISVN